MTLKLTKHRAAQVKAALANVQAKAAVLADVRDTATARAALNVLWFAVNEASDVVLRAEEEANASKIAKEAA
jgi:hypothetical protein